MTNAAIDYATPTTRSRPRPRPGRRSWRARVEGYWFKPAGPGNLGFARLVFFGLMYWFHRDFDYTIWGTLPPSFQNANPIRLLELLGVGMPTVQGLAVAQFIFKA